MMEPTRASQPPQTEDMANKTSMKKNKNENNGPGFITATASGYAYEICFFEEFSHTYKSKYLDSKLFSEEVPTLSQNIT